MRNEQIEWSQKINNRWRKWFGRMDRENSLKRYIGKVELGDDGGEWGERERVG